MSHVLKSIYNICLPKRHCDEIGRDECTIEKTTYDRIVCTPSGATLKQKIERLLPKGIESCITLVGTPSQLIDVVGQTNAPAQIICAWILREMIQSRTNYFSAR